MEKRLLVVIAKGEKYLRQCEVVRQNIEGYAKRCKADFKVMQELPSDIKVNPQRDIFSWKLLVPYIYRSYDKVLFMDMDIYISQKCKDIYELIPENIGLMAKVQCRGTEKYKRVFKHNKRVLLETNKDYFENNGFEYNEFCQGDINGGVLLFRPNLVADMFKDYYDYGVKSSLLYTGDEPALAYLTQGKGIFRDLGEKFNDECLFFMCEQNNTLCRITTSLPYIYLNKLVYKKCGGQNRMPIQNALFKTIKKRIENDKSYVIHFSGGCWSEKLYLRCCKELGNFS